MKYFVVIAALTIAAVLAWLFFPEMEIDRTSQPTPPPDGSAPAATTAAAAPQRDFKAIITVLQEDMAKIPHTLHDPRSVPDHAFTIQSQIQPALGQHEEYRTLNQACELIIDADKEHSVRGRENQQAQAHVYTSPLDEVKADALNKTRHDAIDKQAEAAWSTYRQQTESEVQRLLNSLADKRL